MLKKEINGSAEITVIEEMPWAVIVHGVSLIVVFMTGPILRSLFQLQSLKSNEI